MYRVLHVVIILVGAFSIHICLIESAYPSLAIPTHYNLQPIYTYIFLNTHRRRHRDELGLSL